MWIELTDEYRRDDGKPALRGFQEPWMDRSVEFSDTCRDQVPDDLGEELCERKDHIRPVADDADSTDSESDS